MGGSHGLLVEQQDLHAAHAVEHAHDVVLHSPERIHFFSLQTLSGQVHAQQCSPLGHTPSSFSLFLEDSRFRLQSFGGLERQEIREKGCELSEKEVGLGMSSLFSFWKPTSPQAPATTPKKKRDRRNESFSAQRRTPPASPGIGGNVQTVNVLQKRKRQVTYATPGASPAKRRPQQQREGETSHQWGSTADSPLGGFNSSYQFLSGLFSPSPSKRLEEEQRRREREERETVAREQELERERERAAEEESKSSLAALLLPWATQKFSTTRQPLSLYEEALEEEYEEQEGYDYQSSMRSAPAELIELSSDDEAPDDFLADDSPMGDTPFRPKAIKPRREFFSPPLLWLWRSPPLTDCSNDLLTGG